MKLYDFALAPSPRRVRIFLAEKGVEIPTVQVNLRGREQLTPEFAEINPNCTVPVLELDDGTRIFESIAICRYLEAAYPEPPLMGVKAKEQGVIAMWEHRCEIEGFLAGAEALRNSAEGFKDRALTGPHDYAQIPALAERGLKRMGHFLDMLDERLGKSEYLAGPTYTVADITALVVVDFFGRMKVEIPESHANLKRWHDAVSARPSAKA